MLINISKLVSHPENNQILPSLTKEEEKNLSDSLSKEIKPVPLEVLERNDGTYLILDGNNRVNILNQMKHKGDLECLVLGKEKDWPIEKQEERMLDTNLTRRNLSKTQKMDIAKFQVAKGKTQEGIAKILGISQQTVSHYTKDIKETRQDVLKKSIAMLRGARLTQEKTAEVVGLSQQSVANIEKGLDISDQDTQNIDSIILEVKNQLQPNEILALASTKPKVQKNKKDASYYEKWKNMEEENSRLKLECQNLQKEKENLLSKIEEQARMIEKWKEKTSSEHLDILDTDEQPDDAETDEQSEDSETDEQSEDSDTDEQPDDSEMDEQLGISDEDREILSGWNFYFVPKRGKQCAKNSTNNEVMEFDTRKRNQAKAELLKKLKERKENHL